MKTKRKPKWQYSGWAADRIAAQKFCGGLVVIMAALFWRDTLPVVAKLVVGGAACLGFGIGLAWVIGKVYPGKSE